MSNQGINAIVYHQTDYWIVTGGRIAGTVFYGDTSPDPGDIVEVVNAALAFAGAERLDFQSLDWTEQIDKVVGEEGCNEGTALQILLNEGAT